MKIHIFMEVLKLVIFLCGWWLSSVGGDYSFWVVNFLWVVLSLYGVRLVYPTKVGHHPQRAFTTNRRWSPNSKTSIKRSDLFLDSTSVFIKYLGLKIIEEFNLDHFCNLHENVQSFSSRLIDSWEIHKTLSRLFFYLPCINGHCIG